MRPATLVRYAFYWSQARLLIAAAALFLGGVPPLIYLFPAFADVGANILYVFWIVSGIVSAYLLYHWLRADQKLFGHQDYWDLAAFWVSIISGINMGFNGIFHINIGMRISTDPTVFMIVGVIYLLAALRLFTRYRGHSNKLF